MPISFEKKGKLVDELKDTISISKSIVFADFSGLVSSAMNELRRKLRSEGVAFKVVKKTLLKRAFFSLNMPKIKDEEIPGQLSVAMSGDEIKAAKVVYSFIKESKTENLSILGGFLEQRYITKQEVIELAKIPGKEELLGRLVGTVQAPVSGLVNVLGGNIRNLIFVLKQLSNK